MIWLWLLLACPKKEEAGPDPTWIRPVAETPSPTLRALTSPGTWSGAGVRMSVPPGWSGHGGVVGGALALSMSHESGVTIEVWEWPRQGATPMPRPREDCDVLFVDEGAWRDIPDLAVEVVASCVPDEPQGRVVQGWYAVVGDHEVHVEVLFPAGRVIEGRRLVEPILRSLEPAP